MNKKVLTDFVFLTLMAVLLSAMPVQAQSAAYFQAMTNLNPAGYWPMHEVEAPAPGDIETNWGTLGVLGNGYYADYAGITTNIGHGYAGALTNCLNSGDTAVNFESSAGVANNNFVIIPHTSPLMTLGPPFTAEAWVKCTGSPTSTAGMAFIGEGGNNGLNNVKIYDGFQCSWGYNMLTAQYYTGGNNTFTSFSTQSNYTASVWWHYVATYDGTNVLTYVNGVQEGGGTLTTMVPSKWSPLCIGSGKYSAGPNRAYPGYVDEVAIYTNVLSAGQIGNHYLAGTTTGSNYFQTVLNDNPLLYYHMDAPAYTAPSVGTWPALTNYGSVAGNGVYTPGSTPGSVAGPSNPSGVPWGGLLGMNAAPGNGMSSFGDAGNNALYNPTGSGATFSVSAMFQGNPADPRVQSIVGHGSNSWQLVLNTYGQIVFNAGTGGGTGAGSSASGDLTASITNNDGNWHQVVAVHNGTNNWLYVDGALNASNSSTVSIPGSAQDVMIGADPSFITNNVSQTASDALGKQFAGQVCEVAFFTNALTSNQVQTLYNASGVSGYTGPGFITLTIANSPGYAIPNNFSGLGFETQSELKNQNGVSGYFWSAANSQLITLFQNLSLHNLRLGGATVDGALNTPIPTDTNIDNVFAFVQAVGGLDVIYSLRLLNGNRLTDAAAAQYIWQNYQPLLACFAIGNEPDVSSYLYPPFGTGTDPLITNYTSYLADWVNFATTIRSNVPNATFAAPDAAHQSWAQLFANDEAGSGIIKVITQHYYQGGLPGTTTIQQAIDAMLSTNWVDTAYPAEYNAATAPVLAYGLPYRLTESNDYLNGVTNASNAFASALWALDYMHWWAAHNCAGVNFHNRQWIPTDTIYLDRFGNYQINPKGYGIKAWDLGGHGNVEPLTLTNTNGLNLTAYAVGDTTNLYVTIINKEHNSGARDATVTIMPNGISSGSVAVMFLTVPNGNAAATNGMTLGGASITNNAPWLGQWTMLSPVTNGQCTVTVPATSAAVVKITAAVPDAPVIVQDLPSQVSVVSGKSYTYSIGVVGMLPISYQWYKVTTPVAGQTNSTYAVTAGSPGSTTYYVVITNIYGAVTSSVSTFTSIAPLANSYATNVLGVLGSGHGPVGYWPLQETNAPAPGNWETNYGSLGRLGNAYYACTNATNVAFDQAGALAGDTDPSVLFSGSAGTNPNSYAFVPRVSTALTIQAPFTLEAWVNLSTTTYGVAIGEGGGTGLNGGTNFGGWQMGMGASAGNQFQMSYYTGVGNSQNGELGASLFYTLGQWYHYVVTYDGLNSTLYVNGRNILTATSPNAADTWSPLAIGAGKWDFGPIGGIRWFTGNEDEVAIYTNVLSALQITNHYLAGTAVGSNYMQTVLADNPLLYYRMDAPGYTNPSAALYPEAVNYGSALPNGAYLPGIVPGEISGPPIAGLGTNSVAAPINGVISCVDAGYDPAFNPTGTQPFTAMTWFRTYPADGRVQTIMSHGTNWTLNLNGTSGKLVWNVGAGSVTSANILNDGNWHQVAGVYDGSACYLYVDGALNISGAAAGSLTSDAGDDLYLGGNAAFTQVGANQQYFSGAIAQAAFYTNALTATQIQAIYSAAASVTPTISVAHSGNNVTITYAVTLLSSTNATGPYQPVPGATNPYTTPATNAQQFYRSSSP